MFLLALCMVMPMAAQNNKELNKQLKKEYRLKMKTLKKEYWALFGSSRSLEVRCYLSTTKNSIATMVTMPTRLWVLPATLFRKT